MDSGASPARARWSAAQEERIGRLAERYNLAPEASSRLATLQALLVSDRTAPTSLRDPDRVFADHLADSLVALEVERVRTAARAADLGSGAGLPGLPLAIALTGLHMSLIESTSRKCEFIQRAVSACSLANASVVCERVESWRSGWGGVDLVTARALAPLSVVVEYAAPLLQVGGVLVAWRGKRDHAAEEAGAHAASLLGLEPVEVRAVQPYPRAEHRHLHLMLKVRDTPTGFPRRPGMAVKRPLRG